MKKKASIILSILIGSALLVSTFGLTACGSGSSGSGVTVKSSDPLQEISQDVSIEKTTLLDIPEITITADSLSFKNDSLTLELTMVNKLNTPIEVNAGTVGFGANFINSYMVTDGYMLTDLGPNETVTDDIKLSTQEMKMYGISQIAEIGIGITVKHDQSTPEYPKYNHDEIYQEILMIKTNNYDSVDMSVDTYPDAINNKAMLDLLKATMISFNDEGGFDQNGISIKSLGLLKNKDDEVYVLVEIQNDTSSIVMTRASDISINGEMVYEGSWTGDTIAPGKIAVMDINLAKILDARSDSTQGVDLNNVSQVGIEFSVRDADSNTIVSPTELEFSF